MFHISKYPTLKLLRNGQSAKKEYRGQVCSAHLCKLSVMSRPTQRSLTALSDYVKGQLADPVKEYTGGDAMGKLVCNILTATRCSYSVVM